MGKMAVPPKNRHKRNLCLHRKTRSKRVRNTTTHSVVRVGVGVVCVVGTVGIGLVVISARNIQSAIPATSSVCLLLAPVPPPPVPTPDQDFARAYTNSILASIRSELGCG